MSGWQNQLHSLGYSGGVYGAPADANTDWYFAAYPPDAVWIAKLGTNNINAPNVGIWGLSPLLDTRWATTPGSRIHQYLENFTVAWGGVSLQIDHDLEDGDVVVGSANKTYLFTATDFDFPGAMQTTPISISGVSQSGKIGTVAGFYLDSAANSHGFTRDGTGNFTSFDYPGTTFTVLYGINDVNQMVGYFYAGNGSYPAFLYNAGSWSSFQYPGAFLTVGTGINDTGHIAGYYENSGGDTHAFLKYGNTFYSFDYPGAITTYAWGINGDSEIVGTYVDSGGYTHGYTATTLPASGTFSSTSIDYPGALQTYTTGINNNGQVVGSATHSIQGNDTFFLLNNNTFVPIPGTNLRDVYGVNDASQTVGDYYDSSNNSHGFLTVNSVN